MRSRLDHSLACGDDDGKGETMLVFFILVRRRNKPSRLMSARCRICFGETPPFISPCACDGSLAHVHPACLREWRRRSHRTICEICKRPYRVDGAQEIDLWVPQPHLQLWRHGMLAALLVVAVSHVLPTSRWVQGLSLAAAAVAVVGAECAFHTHDASS